MLYGGSRDDKKSKLSMAARIIFGPVLCCPVFEGPDKSLLVTSLQKHFLSFSNANYLHKIIYFRPTFKKIIKMSWIDCSSDAML